LSPASTWITIVSLATDRDTSVLIIGGGIAGLTAAIALRQVGIESMVFEQADDLGKTQVGSGLSLGYNVTRAFKHLGLIDELTDFAAPIAALQFTTDKGKHVGTGRELEGELALGVIRPRFHEFLVRTLGEDEIQIGAKLVRFEQDDDGVTAQFADGQSVRGDVLIGADGMQSTVRKQLLGDADPHYSGYVTRRGVLETDAAQDGIMRIILGYGQRFLSYPVGRWWVYWTASTNEPAGGKEDAAEIKQNVMETFQGWPDPVLEFVEATDASHVFLADTYDRDPVTRWGDGRVTLLGDSAHPMTWDRGQGAGQAIEGAVLLARELAGADDPVPALRAWEAQRIPRTKKIVRSSRVVGKLGQSTKAVPRFLFKRVVNIETRDAFFRRANRDLLVEYGGTKVRSLSGHVSLPVLLLVLEGLQYV
jgi:2-polyprenyl-6-methoxyphenol hydroxylase-like FAD-dependent oxidoreductase